MSARQIIESKYFKVAAATCGVLLVALVSFAAGVGVGFRKALFSARFGENYERNFLGGSREGDGRTPAPFGMMGRMRNWVDGDERGARNPHGVSGEVVSVSGDTIVIKNRDNQESTVRVSNTTAINRGKETIALGDIVSGDRVVVIGRPADDGTIAARLIRVFPAGSNPISQ